MADGPLETALVFFGLICALALVLLLVTGEKGGAMHKTKPNPKPMPPVPPINDISYDRIVIVKLDQILTNIQLVLTELRNLSGGSGGDGQARIDAITARLVKSTGALKGVIGTEPK